MGGWGTDRRHFILDVIETFDINLGRWATSGSTLPRLMTGLRAANIDGRVLIFGNYCQAPNLNPFSPKPFPLGEVSEFSNQS